MGYRAAAAGADNTKMSAADVKAYTAKVNKPPSAKDQIKMAGMKAVRNNFSQKMSGSVGFDD